MEVEVLGMKAKLPLNFFASEVIGGRNGEVEIDRFGAVHTERLRHPLKN